jgi:TonB-dependent SusC/RagA subfamily outer membrane receptor
MKITVCRWHNHLLLLSALTFTACSGSRQTALSGQDPNEIVDSGYKLGATKYSNQSNIMVQPNEEVPSNLELNEMLLTLPGVRVQGRGAYAKITVQGVSGSFMAGSDPLFVVDGRTIGTDYSMVYTLVDPKKVVSLSVLKGADASIYGSRGANGVILIRTK